MPANSAAPSLPGSGTRRSPGIRRPSGWLPHPQPRAGDVMIAHAPVFARFVRVAATAIAGLVLFALPAAGQAPPKVAEGCPGEYVIGHEDVLEIAVWNNTTITRTVPVRPDGKISL